MARPREFDTDEAVEKAMSVFWKHGYAGASLPDLLEGMGIARGSFYKAFGSKKAVFLKALDRYDTGVVEPAVAMLKAGDGDGLHRISAVFNGSLRLAMEGDRDGCLLCNAAAENGDGDPDIIEKVNDQLTRLTSGFTAALSDSIIWSAVSAEKRLAQAQALTMSYVGLRILSRGGDVKALERSVERTLSALRNAR